MFGTNHLEDFKMLAVISKQRLGLFAEPTGYENNQKQVTFDSYVSSQQFYADIDKLTKANLWSNAQAGGEFVVVVVVVVGVVVTGMVAFEIVAIDDVDVEFVLVLKSFDDELSLTTKSCE
uniref:Uncharacterized protein n=1 Tax=Glossina pallidipes TaxID=7398 RepID=A0A1B0AB89_GLOPL